MTLVRITDQMIINAEDIIAAVRWDDGAMKIVMHGTVRDIEVGPTESENAWAAITRLCRDAEE